MTQWALNHPYLFTFLVICLLVALIEAVTKLAEYVDGLLNFEHPHTQQEVIPMLNHQHGQ